MCLKHNMHLYPGWGWLRAIVCIYQCMLTDMCYCPKLAMVPQDQYVCDQSVHQVRRKFRGVP